MNQNPKLFRCIMIVDDKEILTMSGTKAGAKLTAQRLTAANPNYFSELSRKAEKPRGGHNSVGSFSSGSDRAKEAGKRGGQTSRRSAAKNQKDFEGNAIGKIELEYTEYETE